MKGKKKKGSVEFFISLMMIFFTVLLITVGLKMRYINMTKNYIEDGLVASNLASAVIDLSEYGLTGNLVINDFEHAFDLFGKAIKDNLKLDHNYVPTNSMLINSKVDIIEYSIYNVSGSNVYLTKKSQNGTVQTQTFLNGRDQIQTPNGVKITDTMIYSKIGFEIRGYADSTQYVLKENSVDIAEN